MNAKARRSKGVMVIELAAAALVFAIAVTGYFGIQAVKGAHILAAKELSLAQQGCANKLEELRALSVEAAGQLEMEQETLAMEPCLYAAEVRRAITAPPAGPRTQYPRRRISSS